MNRERQLFLSIWGVIILGVAIWRFWPDPNRAPTQTVPVVLAKELNSWFVSAKTAEIQPSFYSVDLILNPQYRATIEDTRTAQLGYQLVGDSGVLFEGTAPCALGAKEKNTRVALPNPKRITARSLHLYLAR